MNKLYILAALALVSGSLSAQHLATPRSKAPIGRHQAPVQQAMPSVSDQAFGTDREGEVVFSEDFQNGFDGNNGIGAWTVQGPNGNVWRYTHAGPVGQYSDHTEAIASSSATNGWMILNTDSANCNWSDPANPVLQFPLIAFDAGLVSPLIDLSANPYVQVEVQQRLRYCCTTATQFLEVSTDGGNTWTARYPLAIREDGTEIDGNDDPGTFTRKVNITAAIAADPTNVKIRFYHDGSSSIDGDNNTGTYHWQIDDVKITVVPDHDLQISTAAMWHWDFETANSYDSLRYTVVPVDQRRALGINLTYFNNGTNVESNTVATFSSDDGYTGTVDLGDVAQGASDLVYAAPEYIPSSTVGDHTMTFTLESDSVDGFPADNTRTDKVTVSDYIYARDNGARDGYSTNTQNPDEPNAAYLLGNMFFVKEEATLYAIDVAFATGSTVGTFVNAQLTDDSRTPIAETAEYTIAQSDLNATGGDHFVSLIFDEPVFIDAGTDVGVFIHHFGGDVVRTCTSGNSIAQTSHIFDEPTGTWFYTTNTPMVRMNFNPTVGIAENDVRNGVGLGQSFPNPAKGNAFIDYSLVNGGIVTMELHDVSGKLVRTLVNGNMAPGVHRVQVDTNDLQEGVYFYTLVSNGTRATKRMTVVH